MHIPGLRLHAPRLDAVDRRVISPGRRRALSGGSEQLAGAKRDADVYGRLLELLGGDSEAGDDDERVLIAVREQPAASFAFSARAAGGAIYRCWTRRYLAGRLTAPPRRRRRKGQPRRAPLYRCSRAAPVTSR